MAGIIKLKLTSMSHRLTTLKDLVGNLEYKKTDKIR